MWFGQMKYLNNYFEILLDESREYMNIKCTHSGADNR